MRFSDFIDGGRIAAGGLQDFATGLFHPTLRLGVTGLSRSGKTVFITALVHALLKGARMPMFEAHAKGRITRCYLEPQPNDDLPRFAYEEHLAALTGENRHWPEGTKRISQLRLTFEYEPQGFLARRFHGGKLHVDIVDYPGEWLLDLPLMTQSYQQWSSATIAMAKKPPRLTHAAPWLELLKNIKSNDPQNEMKALEIATDFTSYLARCRESDVSLSTLPPGRFLMPGDLAGSPLLSFAPLDISADEILAPNSLAAIMARRYDSYVLKVVKPFFHSHFSRLDRQIVMVDVLSSLNAGAAAVADLQQALNEVLSCFRIGENSLLSELFGRRVERLLFAATKADQLHHTDHDQLENILRTLIETTTHSAEASGARHDVAALASIRSTREAKVTQKGQEIPCIVGTPIAGEQIGKIVFDGEKDAAIFPGDLPKQASAALDGQAEGKLHFVRFRPPANIGESFPHIRLDRAIEFLLGDRFA